MDMNACRGTGRKKEEKKITVDEHGRGINESGEVGHEGLVKGTGRLEPF